MTQTGAAGGRAWRFLQEMGKQSQAPSALSLQSAAWTLSALPRENPHFPCSSPPHIGDIMPPHSDSLRGSTEMKTTGKLTQPQRNQYSSPFIFTLS